MLFKWITCRVHEHMRDAFFAAQTKWTTLANMPGFIGQLGGWDLKSRNEACILGIWQDQESYNAFMDQHHDRIFQKNEQARTCESIHVALLQPVCAIAGSYENMHQCLRPAEVMRVADCFVLPEREKNFLEVQEKIWNPAMGKAEGILAGSFTRVLNRENRYIVTTLWSSVEAHNRYVRKTLPSVSEAACVPQDVQQITGRL
jgi:heme-degrading monooxygenase HmoA